jgi:tRNA U34 2-thiouridine synthase MnmA/TrmU
VLLNFEPRENQKLRKMQPETTNLNAKGLMPCEEEKVEENCSNLNANESVLKADKKSSDIEEYFIKVKERKKRTDVSFSMKKIDKNKLREINNSNSPSNKPISAFSCRADVIYKRVLRDFRRYFVNKFANFTKIVDLTSVRKKRESFDELCKFKILSRFRQKK